MNDLVEIGGGRILVDLLYLTDLNLFEKPLYKALGVTQALLHRDALPLLEVLGDELVRRDLYLVVFDAWRPVAAQRAMWDILPDARYVAPPDQGSKHNRGAALDVYLLDKDKMPLPFPTAPDGYYPGCGKDIPKWLSYLEKAHHGVEIPGMAQECANRDLLKSVMVAAGFIPLQEEWWHYELPDAGRYPIIP